MADTGAPWNLPYPLSTDLVRDGAQAIEDLAENVANALTVAYTGIGSNVVTATKTDVFSASVANPDAITGDVTGLVAAITPTTTASRVLVIASVSISSATVGSTAATQGFVYLYRNGSVSSFRGDGSRRTTQSVGLASGGDVGAIASFAFLDSPGSTSTQTYSIRIGCNRGDGDTVYVNRTRLNVNTQASSLTVIEVAA